MQIPRENMAAERVFRNPPRVFSKGSSHGSGSSERVGTGYAEGEGFSVIWSQAFGYRTGAGAPVFKMAVFAHLAALFCTVERVVRRVL